MSRGIVPVGHNLDPQTKKLLERHQELLEVGEGMRGNPLHRYLKAQDLLDLGLAKMLGKNAQRIVSGENLVPTTPAPDYAIPPAPTGFKVTSGFSHVFLSWDDPQSLYRNHAYTLIYRNTINNVANAVVIAQVATGSLFADLDVSYGSTYYYWIRFVSEADVMGPFNSSVGLAGKVSEDPAELLARLQGEIRETHLYADLNARINLIDAPGTGLVAKVQVQKQEIDGLNANYTVKIDNNGYVSGFGLSSESATGEPHSLFLVSSDRFAISNPNANQILLSNLTRSGAIATATSAGHGLSVGDKIVMTRARDTRWNGMWTILSVPNANTFTFACAGNETTPGVGLIRANGYPVTSITRSGAVATAIIPSNDFVVGQSVAFIGADQPHYNGDKTITYVSGSEVRFSISTAAPTTATASIVAARGAIPFVVDNGRVVIDGAWIKTASINTAQVGTISVDKIVGIDANFINLRIENGSITNAKIGDFIQSNNYVAGVSGWRINKDGGSEFQNVHARGNIRARSLEAGIAMVDTLNVNGGSVTSMMLASGIPGSVSQKGSNRGTPTLAITAWNKKAVETPSLMMPAGSSGVVINFGLFVYGNDDDCQMYVDIFRNSTLIGSVTGAYHKWGAWVGSSLFDPSPASSNVYTMMVSSGRNGNGNGDRAFSYSDATITLTGGKR